MMKLVGAKSGSILNILPLVLWPKIALSWKAVFV
jgi:hypothetical protein